MPRHDIRVTSEVSATSRHKLHELGLDPADTTAEELYQALNQRLLRDDTILQQAIGLPLGAPIDDMYRSVRRSLEPSAHAVRSFSIKPAVAKRMLRAHPPKRTIKLLQYRSVESLLRHEPVSAVLFVARSYESAAWRKQLTAAYERLTAADFEERPVDVLLLGSAKWRQAIQLLGGEQHRTSAIVPEAGAIMLFAPPIVLPALTITTYALVLAQLNALRSMYTYLKLQHVSPGFGHAVVCALDEYIDIGALFGERSVSWHTIHRYYAADHTRYNPFIFEPHVSPDELQWVEPERLLGSLHAALDFWHDTARAAVTLGGEHVSLNIFDVAVNSANNLPFTARSQHVFREAMWQELMLRYMNLDHIETALKKQLALV